MTWRAVFASAPFVGAVVAASCGSPAVSTPTATFAPTASATLAPTPTSNPTATPSSTAAATASELTALAAMVYPACTPASCVGNAMFTTCDAGSSGSNVFASCPLTTRLAAQLQMDVAGVVSAPDPLGGGQDPEWTKETFTSAQSSTGGVVHVVLQSGPSAVTQKIDLVVVLTGSQLLVDDLYCTGSDPSSSDVFASGWLSRSVCTS